MAVRRVQAITAFSSCLSSLIIVTRGRACVASTVLLLVATSYSSTGSSRGGRARGDAPGEGYTGAGCAYVPDQQHQHSSISR